MHTHTHPHARTPTPTLQVEMLVEVGGAYVDPEDRWHASPLQNARDVGAQPVVEYLEPLYEQIKKVGGRGAVRCGVARPAAMQGWRR